MKGEELKFKLIKLRRPNNKYMREYVAALERGYAKIEREKGKEYADKIRNLESEKMEFNQP